MTEQSCPAEDEWEVSGTKIGLSILGLAYPF